MTTEADTGDQRLVETPGAKMRNRCRDHHEEEKPHPQIHSLRQTVKDREETQGKRQGVLIHILPYYFLCQEKTVYVPIHSVPNIVCQKYQAVLMQSAPFWILFWLFWPTVLCSIKHIASTREDGQMTEATDANRETNMSPYASVVWHANSLHFDVTEHTQTDLFMDMFAVISLLRNN